MVRETLKRRFFSASTYTLVSSFLTSIFLLWHEDSRLVFDVFCIIKAHTRISIFLQCHLDAHLSLSFCHLLSPSYLDFKKRDFPSCSQIFKKSAVPSSLKIYLSFLKINSFFLSSSTFREKKAVLLYA